MSDGTPKKVIPRQIEPRKFAHHGTVLQGLIPADGLPRLAEAVIQVLSVEASLSFELGEQRERLVVGSVSAQLERQCQRCLQPVVTEVNCQLKLAVVRDEDKAKQLPSHLDPWIVEEEEADLYQAIEDDILLTMPFVAVHDYDCLDPEFYQSGPEEAEQTTAPAANNPFDVLQQLKKPKK